MQIIICIAITAGALFFGIGSFYLATKTRKENKALENEIKEARENEQKTAEIITEANKTKAEANSGDIDNDLNYMAGKLHDLAKN